MWWLFYVLKCFPCAGSSLILKSRFSESTAHFNSFFILCSFPFSWPHFIHQNNENRTISLKMRSHQSSRLPLFLPNLRASSSLHPLINLHLCYCYSLLTLWSRYSIHHAQSILKTLLKLFLTPGTIKAIYYI